MAGVARWFDKGIKRTDVVHNAVAIRTVDFASLIAQYAADGGHVVIPRHLSVVVDGDVSTSAVCVCIRTAAEAVKAAAAGYTAAGVADYHEVPIGEGRRFDLYPGWDAVSFWCTDVGGTATVRCSVVFEAN